MQSKVVHPIVRESPNVNTHCVAHQEALVASDAFKVVWKLLILDDFGNKVYTWVGRSCIWQKELKSLMDLFDLLSLTILQFHSIHWLFQGQVLERIVYYMLAIFDVFKYMSLIVINMLPLFNFNSCFHLVVDVLVELNKLNKKNQFDMVSISIVGCTFDASISIL